MHDLSAIFVVKETMKNYVFAQPNVPITLSSFFILWGWLHLYEFPTEKWVDKATMDAVGVEFSLFLRFWQLCMSGSVSQVSIIVILNWKVSLKSCQSFLQVSDQTQTDVNIEWILEFCWPRDWPDTEFLSDGHFLEDIPQLQAELEGFYEWLKLIDLHVKIFSGKSEVNTHFSILHFFFVVIGFCAERDDLHVGLQDVEVEQRLIPTTEQLNLNSRHNQPNIVCY